MSVRSVANTETAVDRAHNFEQHSTAQNYVLDAECSSSSSANAFPH